MFKRVIASLVIVCFTFTLIQPMGRAQSVNLPTPGTMVNPSPAHVPVLIKGIKIHPENPLLFDFIIDKGDYPNRFASQSEAVGVESLKVEATRLIKYFLACLTIPEEDLWVNLSPYEKDRMIPKELGQTDLGRDMLAQDYILKQLTASLIYPEKNLGKKFWDRVYAKVQQLYGTIQIPVNTFNKVWILPDKAGVFVRSNTALVVEGHLKVLLEADYLALQKANASKSIPIPPKAGEEGLPQKDPSPDVRRGQDDAQRIGSEVVRQLILPEIEKEVNTGKNFAPLRQMFYSLILASWYKKNLKEALLNQVYADKGKIKGVETQNFASLQPKDIYQMYLQAYKKGVFNYIKEDVVNVRGAQHAEPVPRKYFSGGLGFGNPRSIAINPQVFTDPTDPIVRTGLRQVGDLAMVTAGMANAPDAAMTASAQELSDLQKQAEALGSNPATLLQQWRQINGDRPDPYQQGQTAWLRLQILRQKVNQWQYTDRQGNKVELKFYSDRTADSFKAQEYAQTNALGKLMEPQLFWKGDQNQRGHAGVTEVKTTNNLGVTKIVEFYPGNIISSRIDHIGANADAAMSATPLKRGDPLRPRSEASEILPIGQRPIGGAAEKQELNARWQAALEELGNGQFLPNEVKELLPEQALQEFHPKGTFKDFVDLLLNNDSYSSWLSRYELVVTWARNQYDKRVKLQNGRIQIGPGAQPDLVAHYKKLKEMAEVLKKLADDTLAFSSRAAANAPDAAMSASNKVSGEILPIGQRPIGGTATKGTGEEKIFNLRDLPSRETPQFTEAQEAVRQSLGDLPRLGMTVRLEQALNNLGWELNPRNPGRKASIEALQSARPGDVILSSTTSEGTLSKGDAEDRVTDTSIVYVASSAVTERRIFVLVESPKNPTAAPMPWERGNRAPASDKIMKGGIDFNSRNMQMDVNPSITLRINPERSRRVNGEKIDIRFDPAMVEQFKRGDFTGVRPVILNITPIPSLYFLFDI